MILKKFFGKTIEMARKSARQMYGDDIVILESFDADGKNDAGVTVLVDSPAASSRKKDKSKEEESRFRNVFYQRSDIAPAKSTGNEEKSSAKEKPPEKISNNLKSLRELAHKEMEKNKKQPVAEANPDRYETTSDPYEATSDRPAATAAGQRKKTRFQPGAGTSNIRGFGKKARNGILEDTSNNLTGNSTATKSFSQDSPAKQNGTGYDNMAPGNSNRTKFVPGIEPDRSTEDKEAAQRYRFQPSNTQDVQSGETASLAAKNQREVSALHKRFDKLESLLDSALISSNLDYASHPAFQQLVQTGIKPTVIARWFREIMESGIDPDEQPGQFMSALSSIIRRALKSENHVPPEKFMMFVGPSGSGKTHLIMKLLLHPEYLAGKKLAVVSLLPPEQQGQPFYTILKPFCEDHGITCYTVRDTSDVKAHIQDWEAYDHVLIDSPAIPVEQESSFRQYWKMRQTIASLTELEVHYVVNASLNRYYFRTSGSVHQPLQPDFVAITHLDEVSEWGPVIPFLEEMGCGARYISMGSSVPGGLAEFSPAWFAQQVLQDT